MGYLALVITLGFIATTSYKVAKEGKLDDPYKNFVRNQEIASVIFSSFITGTLAVFMIANYMSIYQAIGLTSTSIVIVTMVSAILGYYNRKWEEKNGQ